MKCFVMTIDFSVYKYQKKEKRVSYKIL